jgi:ATP-dependent Clp protease ATP-binding subunit ClpC
VGVCKAAEVSISEVLNDGGPELQQMKGQVESDFLEVREAFAAVGVSPKQLRRSIRAGLGRETGGAGRPLHRSMALRKVFKTAAAVAKSERERLRPMHLIAALTEQFSPEIEEAMTRLGYDPSEVMRGLLRRVAEARPGERPETPRPMAQDKKEEKKMESALRRFGRDLTELAAQGALPPLIGRREEMLKITQILLQSRKNNLILVGEPGVGKTGIVEGFAQLLAEGKLLDALGRPAVRRVDTLVHRANGWREKSDLRPSTFAFHWHVGETTTLLDAGSASGSMDAANILKPALARGAIRLIGATTNWNCSGVSMSVADFHALVECRGRSGKSPAVIDAPLQTIEKDGALERRFQMVMVEEPSAEEAVAILLALRPRLEEHHGVALEEEALRAAVEWSIRYLPDFRLPDKALDLVDQACAAVRFWTLTPGKSRGETPLGRPGAGRASHRASHCVSNVVGREEIAAAVAARCGIPVGTLTADEGVRLMALEGDLGKRVKGQPEAISAVAEAVRMARAGLKKPNRPMGVFLFVGPSGTGKTEMAKALAENLFHDERRMIRFDMSEFMEEHSVAKLIGAPPGYVGHDEGGQLSDAIRTHPYSVVLFDEIEKAHPKVLDLFLQIFDEGTLTDAQGRKCDFRESVIILTSNLGSGGVVKRTMGFGAEADSGGQDARATAEDAIRKHLRPELVNRLTKVVHFKPLEMDTAREILGKLVVDFNRRLADREVTVNLSVNAEELILREGFSKEYGARNLERAMDRLLGNLVAEALLSGKIAAGQTIQFEAVGGRIQFCEGYAL